jgi:methylthioribose-1-phosphate isomerase
MLKTVEWRDGKVAIIDQTLLPHELIVLELSDYREVAEAITTMKVRGAPALGVAAALGVALGAQAAGSNDWAGFREELEIVAAAIRTTRPTAVNLFWGVDRMLSVAEASKHLSIDEIKRILRAEGERMVEEDIEANRRLGAHGAELINHGDSILTHCNAGALACVGYGTAAGVIRAAWEQGKQIRVYADETRPRLQGMKLTAWELARDGIPVTVIADNMAGVLMRDGKINCCVVGADRIAANGDVANKIGTYSVSVLARAHGIEFYVAAPTSTIDLNLASGKEIPIEERSHEEMTHIDGHRVAPDGVQVINPSFDVTPAQYVSAIVTEKGVARPPYSVSLPRLFN